METPERAIFLAAKPGLEHLLADEAAALAFSDPLPVQGGVEIQGGWAEVMRANLWLRGAERVLWRIAQFRAMHPAQLDKRARKVEWRQWLPNETVVSVEATCRKSRIYHQGAARSRVAGALELAGCRVVEKGGIRILVRIEDDLCTISLDTSGDPLHRRGHKQAVGKAPMRETMAALFLRGCGFDGQGVVLDPMCGSGTFPIEAAEIAARLAPGRSRVFGFEGFEGFDQDLWRAMLPQEMPVEGPVVSYGSDRDQGAVAGAKNNAKRAGVAARTQFLCNPISDLEPPDGPPGLIMVNPPYGGRIGNKKALFGLYAAFGRVCSERFSKWQVGLVTSEDGSARATGLDLAPGRHVAHGGMKVRLWTSKGSQG